MFVISLLVSTIYNFIWDVMMDWGLGHGDHAWLRDRKLFPEVLPITPTIARSLL
jgi:hypothetical protein